jgi:hypothetical protein
MFIFYYLASIMIRNSYSHKYRIFFIACAIFRYFEMKNNLVSSMISYVKFMKPSNGQTLNNEVNRKGYISN